MLDVPASYVSLPEGIYKVGPYKWSYNPHKEGYNPSYPFIRPIIRVITPCITSRGPVGIKIGQSQFQGPKMDRKFNSHVEGSMYWCHTIHQVVMFLHHFLCHECGYPSSHNHGNQLKNGCISNISFLSFRVIFHWTMIMGERVQRVCFIPPFKQKVYA